MANVKIVVLGDGTWDTFGSIIELTEEDLEKLASDEVQVFELQKAFVSERDAITGEEIKHESKLFF